MKTSNKILTVVAITLVALSGFAQSLNKLKSFTFTIHGTSTLHEWESKVTKAVWTGDVALHDKSLSISKAELKIPVVAIQSEHGKIMDSKTYEAFDSEKNPNIIFKMKSFTQKASGNDIFLAVEGDLTMNGATNLIMLSVIGKT